MNISTIIQHLKGRKPSTGFSSSVRRSEGHKRMAHTIRFTINASLEDSRLVSRILDFKEDIFRELFRKNLGTVVDPESIDRALAPVTIIIPRKRHYDYMATFIPEALDRHEVNHVVQISTEHS